MMIWKMMFLFQGVFSGSMLIFRGVGALLQKIKHNTVTPSDPQGDSTDSNALASSNEAMEWILTSLVWVPNSHRSFQKDAWLIRVVGMIARFMARFSFKVKLSCSQVSCFFFQRFFVGLYIYMVFDLLAELWSEMNWREFKIGQLRGSSPMLGFMILAGPWNP